MGEGARDVVGVLAGRHLAVVRREIVGDHLAGENGGGRDRSVAGSDVIHQVGVNGKIGSGHGNSCVCVVPHLHQPCDQ